MKIILTESQLKTITLNEVKLKDGVREIYRDDNVVVSTRDGKEVSERFEGNVQIYNITNQYIIIKQKDSNNKYYYSMVERHNT